MSHDAEQMLLTGCAEVELCAYDEPNFNRNHEAAAWSRAPRRCGGDPAIS